MPARAKLAHLLVHCRRSALSKLQRAELLPCWSFNRVFHSHLLCQLAGPLQLHCKTIFWLIEANLLNSARDALSITQPDLYPNVSKLNRPSCLAVASQLKKLSSKQPN
jgi:hypothetical protein